MEQARLVNSFLAKPPGDVAGLDRLGKVATRERLGAWLQELELTSYIEPAMWWAKDSGICEMDEVLANLEELAAHLRLMPVCAPGS
jgi:hypothetical protein